MPPGILSQGEEARRGFLTGIGGLKRGTVEVVTDSIIALGQPHPAHIISMKILVVTHYYPPEIGAPQRRWSALVKRWQKSGHQVTVFCPPPHYPDAEASRFLREKHRDTPRIHRGKYGERVLRLPYLLHGPSGVTRLADQIITATSSVGKALILALGGDRFDVVVATVPGLPSAYAGIAIKKLLHVPLVLELRDAWPDIVARPSQEISGIALRERVKRRFSRSFTRAQRQADVLVTVTHRFARKLRGRNMQEVVTITNGVTPTMFHSRIDPAPQRPGQLRLLYSGTVGRSQGLITLLQALELAQKAQPETRFKLRIVGEGAERQMLQDYARARNLPVKFQPLQPRSQVRKNYKWCDATIVSLKNTPAFERTVPSKLYELLTVPRFPIALVTGEAADIMQAAGVGALVEPENPQELADLWCRLATDRSLLQVGHAGRDFIFKNYNYDQLAQRYLTVLEKAVETGRTHS
ncbi:glycosyltransferase family 4 protein [Rothia sp. P5766]|uniref:glycosyltransferase family 4 protein n=1 Tax=Rothia sp. P5766 TaxID=3402656 RepID=UPI003ADF5DB8